MGRVLDTFVANQDFVGIEPLANQPSTGLTFTPCDITDVEGNKAYFNQLCVGPSFLAPAYAAIQGSVVNQAVPTANTFVSVNWPATPGGLTSIHNLATYISGTSGGLQVNLTGLYIVNFNIQFTGGAAMWGAAATKNGTQISTFINQQSIVITWESYQLANAGDIFSLQVENTTGATTLNQVTMGLIFVGYATP